MKAPPDTPEPPTATRGACRRHRFSAVQRSSETVAAAYRAWARSVSSTGNQKRVSGPAEPARLTITDRGNIMPKFANGYSKNGGFSQPSPAFCANSISRYWPQRSAITTSPILRPGSTPPAMPEKTMLWTWKTVERGLHRHRCIHHADTAQEQHDIAALEPAGDELDAVHGIHGTVLEARLQDRHFRQEGRDDGDPARAVVAGMRSRRQCERRRHQGPNGETGDGSHQDRYPPQASPFGNRKYLDHLSISRTVRMRADNRRYSSSAITGPESAGKQPYFFRAVRQSSDLSG